MLQILLVWVALYLVRFSVPKGGTVRTGKRLIGDTVTWREEVKDGGRGVGAEEEEEEEEEGEAQAAEDPAGSTPEKKKASRLFGVSRRRPAPPSPKQPAAKHHNSFSR